MDNVITEKRGLVLILVIATVVIFVGLVWVIATYLPLNLLGVPSPSFTADSPRVGTNCTYPVSYWKEHPELYPAQIVIGGQLYKADNVAEIFSDQTKDLYAQVQVQLTTAYLNILSGADQSYIETTIFEAYGWLVQHPAGSQVQDSEREAGTRLFNVLEAYNLGLTGVTPCLRASGLTLTITSTPTETPTVLLTITPSETPTPTPSESPTPTELTATATNFFIYPTSTAIPTIKPTIQIPTNTPIQPTEPPTATNTTMPTNTTAPTLPPQPTAIPTFPPTPTANPTFPPAPTP
jgi:hypothetical protein